MEHKNSFNAHLDKFDLNNDFSKHLVPFVDDTHQFCVQLCTNVNATIEFDHSKSFSSTSPTNRLQHNILQRARISSQLDPSTTHAVPSILSKASKRINMSEAPRASKQRKISKFQEDQDQLGRSSWSLHIGNIILVYIQFGKCTHTLLHTASQFQ